MATATKNSCCRCCEAAAERGELDHKVGHDCPYLPCDFCTERGWLHA